MIRATALHRTDRDRGRGGAGAGAVDRHDSRHGDRRAGRDGARGDDRDPSSVDRSRAIGPQRCGRRLSGALAAAGPVPRRGPAPGLPGSGPRRRGRSGAHRRREHPSDRRRRGRERERDRRDADHRDGDHLGRSGHHAADGSGDSAERPPFRRPRTADPGIGDAAGQRLSDRAAARPGLVRLQYRRQPGGHRQLHDQRRQPERPGAEPDHLPAVDQHRVGVQGRQLDVQRRVRPQLRRDRQHRDPLGRQRLSG